MTKKFDPTKLVQCVNGQPARILCTDFKMAGITPQQHQQGYGSIVFAHRPLGAALDTPVGGYHQGETIAYAMPNGVLCNGNANSPLTLINTTVKRWRWLKMNDEFQVTATEEHLTEKDAEARYKEQLVMKIQGTLKESDS
jgi:hypothetical protein